MDASPLAKYTGYTDGSIQIPCSPKLKNGDVQVRWFKDNIPIEPDQARIYILPNGYLEIRKLERGDAGNYKCEIHFRSLKQFRAEFEKSNVQFSRIL